MPSKVATGKKRPDGVGRQENVVREPKRKKDERMEEMDRNQLSVWRVLVPIVTLSSSLGFLVRSAAQRNNIQ